MWMISYLEIELMAIIDKLSIDFSDGLNVITGETGAGKTILVKMLRFLCGEKTSNELIRKGSSFGTVTAKFNLPSSNKVIYEILSELGIRCDEDLVIRRKISNNAGTSAWINDVSVTSQSLKKIGSELFDIFSQHENQKLLFEENHIKYLDKFIINQNILSEYKNIYREFTKNYLILKKLLDLYNEALKTKLYSEHILHEFEELSPTVEDFLGLSEKIDYAKKQHKIQTITSDILKLFEPNGLLVSDIINKIHSKLLNLIEIIDEKSTYYVKLLELEKKLFSISKELDDSNYEFSKILSETEISDSEFDFLQNRLFQYQNLMRKYGVKDIDSLISKYHEIKKEVISILELKEKIDDLINSLKTKATHIENLSRTLSDERRKASVKISKLVEKELSDLSLKRAHFKVEFIPVENKETESELSEIESRMKFISAYGAEKVRFLFSANKGEELLPLSKIASGGEMSRILLAIKKALSVDAETCILVFDEIDAGVSGKVADTIGRKLFELSKDFQVICITHLPQVASYAKTHFLVEKKETGGRTFTKLRKLTDEERLNEIARLISADKISSTSIEHARTLLKKTHNKVMAI